MKANIKKIPANYALSDVLLLDISKSSYAYGRFALMALDLIGGTKVGLLLTHHAIETGIKACLMAAKLAYPKIHKFCALLEHGIANGKDKLSFFHDKIYVRKDFMSVLNDLEKYYGEHKYFEVGSYWSGEIQSVIDEIMFLLIGEFYELRKPVSEQVKVITIHPSMEQLFFRNLKQPFQVSVFDPRK